jgi:hypothetical protein
MAAVVAVLARQVSQRRLSRFHAVLDGRIRDTALVLENVSDSHNAAACLRTADALGVQDGEWASLESWTTFPNESLCAVPPSSRYRTLQRAFLAF